MIMPTKAWEVTYKSGLVKTVLADNEEEAKKKGVAEYRKRMWRVDFAKIDEVVDHVTEK